MNGGGIPGNDHHTFVGVIFNFGKAPEQSQAFTRFVDAKDWCSEHAEYEDCVWVVLSNGVFESGGLIDGMHEEDDEEYDDGWFGEDEDEQEPRL